MLITDSRIDAGKAFDWGRTSGDYAKYRDIYPEMFYKKLVLKYSPGWSGAGETRHPIWIPNVTYEYFEMEDHDEYDMMVPFTKESWHGRMKACRGVGASLAEEELEKWDEEHRALLDKIAPEEFEVLYYAALTVLRKK